MTRMRGYGGPRGGSFRGSGRGGGSWGGGGRSFGSPRGGGRFSSPFTSSPYESRKYSSSSDRFPPRHSDDYRRSYRPDSYSRDSARSPDRKRSRLEAPSSRHDSYGGYGSGRYESSYSERRSFSGERHPPSLSRRSDFRRPSGAPPSSRGGYRGRLSSRRGLPMKFREAPIRRRLLDSSYTIRRRIAPRSSDFGRRMKLNKLRSAIAARRKRHIPSDKEDSDSDKEKDPEKSEVKEEPTDDKEKEKDAGSDKEDKKSESGEEPKRKKVFIKLLCPHCGMKALTFFKYDRHLTSRGHMIAMRKVAMKQKSILNQMRAAQRSAQNELEKTCDDLTTKSSFCPVCKLNYKQKKAIHQATEAHKNMKKFLMPICKSCNITFKSPMMYEHHLCSIDHMKRKQSLKKEDGDSGDEDNLENFTTIDSVGDNDNEEEEETKEDAKVNVGIEHVRKIEAHYCDLCKMYLPRGDETEMPKILSRHCKIRVHMQLYIRKKELQDIEKKAAKLQRKETEEKEKEKSKDEKSLTENGEDVEMKDDSKVNEDDEARDDKLWADVDKDLGDILAEAESGNKSSDEDEEDSHANAERYDRFKLSEKNGEEKLKKDGVIENGDDVKAEEVKEDK